MLLTNPASLISRFLRLVPLALLSACTTLGPDYEQPQAPWLAQWRTSLYGLSESTQQRNENELRFWWQLFNDPQLNRLIDIVRQENPGLRMAGLRILESRAQLGIADSSRYPQLQQLGSSVSYVNTRDQGGALGDSSQSFTSYQLGFNLAWELDFWGRFKRAVEAADAAYFAAISNQRDAQVILVAQTADLYFSYRTLQQRIEIARNNSKIQKRSLEITEQLYRKGQGSELDLQQAKTQYLATLASIPDLQLGLIQTRNALATLLGRPPGELTELQNLPQGLPRIENPRIEALPAQRLLQRPDVRTAAWQVAAQSAQIGIAEADFYPSINLLGSLGWSGNTINGSPNTSLLTAGPSLTWHLFDHGRIANNVRVQDARLQLLIEQYQQTVLQAAREIDDAAYSVIKRQEQQAILHDSVVAAERSLEIASKRYREGYSGFQRVLDAQRAVATQADRELANQGSHISAVIALYKAMGGGWIETPNEALISDSTRETMQQRTDWGDLLNAPLPTQESPVTEASTHE
ncbi:MAG: efflux transporter outer membrane subunit [Candidatus Thiodiazotropha sp.]